MSIENIGVFCALWQKWYSDERSLQTYSEADLDNLLEWARFCEDAAKTLAISDEMAFNKSLIDSFHYLPLHPNPRLVLANATFHVLKFLIQSPHFPEKLLNHLIRTVSRSDGKVSDNIANAAEIVIAEKNLVEMLMNHEAFLEDGVENLPYRAKAGMLAKRLKFIWEIMPILDEAADDENSDRAKVVKSVLEEHLGLSQPLVCLYLLNEVHAVSGLNELVLNQTSTQQFTAFDLGPEADGILCMLCHKYPPIFNLYLVYLMRKLIEIEGNSAERFESVKRKFVSLTKFTSRFCAIIKRILSERQDKSDAREIYDEILKTIFQD